VPRLTPSTAPGPGWTCPASRSGSPVWPARCIMPARRLSNVIGTAPPSRSLSSCTRTTCPSERRRWDCEGRCPWLAARRAVQAAWQSAL